MASSTPVIKSNTLSSSDLQKEAEYLQAPPLSRLPSAEVANQNIPANCHRSPINVATAIQPRHKCGDLQKAIHWPSEASVGSLSSRDFPPPTERAGEVASLSLSPLFSSFFRKLMSGFYLGQQRLLQGM
jgi:hypothetical protein